MARPLPSFGFLALSSALALSAAALAASSGCTVLTNDAPPDDAGLEGGDATVATCPACVENTCTGASALCLTSASCLDVRACATASGCDGTCATACACKPDGDGGVGGGRLYRAYAACHDGGATALAACNSDDAGATDGGDAGTASCASCSSVKCSGPLASCAAGTECAAWLGCVDACSDDACRNGCDSQHTTGKAAAVELAACTGSSCVTECGL